VVGETVVMNVATCRLVGLNQAGAFVWQGLDGKVTVAEIARALARRYRIAEAVALADVTRLLEKLLARDLVELTPR
jgi:hypothetical protein